MNDYIPVVDPVEAIATALIVFLSGKYRTIKSKAHTVKSPAPKPAMTPNVPNIGTRLDRNDVIKTPADVETTPEMATDL